MAKKRPVGRPKQEPSDQRWQQEIEERVARYAAKTREKLIAAAESGREVKKRRLALGISQEKLARSAEVSFKTIAKIEKGLPAPLVLNRVLAALTELEKIGTPAKKSRKKTK